MQNNLRDEPNNLIPDIDDHDNNNDDEKELEQRNKIEHEFFLEFDLREVFFVYPNPAATIADPIKSAEDIFSRNFSSQIYNTRAHREIFGLLISQVQNLTNGNYVNTQGVCSSMMVGSNGIGKTASLKLFSKLVPRIVSNVMTVYVSYNLFFDREDLKNQSLSSLIAEGMTANGYSVCCPRKLSLSESIIDSLENANLYLCILVDELDQLYKAHGREYPSALATLSSLAYFANQPSGRVSVMVCGSTPFMENLITTDATLAIKEQFKLLNTGALNLNRSKFRTKRVHSTLPTDLDAVGSICKLNFTSESEKQYARLLAFRSGCLPRNIDRILKDIDPRGELPQPENTLAGNNTMANEGIRLLKEKIVKKLLKKNRILFFEIYGSGNRRVHDVIKNVVTIPWETRFQPLDYSEVEQIWRKLLSKGEISTKTRGDLLYNVLHLSDRSWLIFDGIENSHPKTIFPSSLESLGNCVIESQSLLTFLDEQRVALRQGPKEFAKYLSNPRIAPALVTTFVAAGVGCLLL